MIYGVLNGSNGGRGQTSPANSLQTTPVVYEDRRARKLMAISSEQYQQQQRLVMSSSSSIERVKKNRQYFTDTI